VIVVVADTSVYVSALVFGGMPQAALAQAMKPPYRLALSVQLKDELVVTLSQKFGWPSERVSLACDHLWKDVLWCTPTAVQASRDPDDDHVLGCAMAAGATILITGDKDLLVLHPFRSTAIVTPAQFLAMHASAMLEQDDGEY